MATPDRLNEIWYQSFHQMPMAAGDRGRQPRHSCRAYIGHFLRHWAHRKDAFDDVLEDWVDNFLRPGNLQGGFDYYRAAHAARHGDDRPGQPRLPRQSIALPACVRWGARATPSSRSAWTDRLGEVVHRPGPGDPAPASATSRTGRTRIGRRRKSPDFSGACFESNGRLCLGGLARITRAVQHSARLFHASEAHRPHASIWSGHATR